MGYLGAAYDDHLRLIGKRTVDFLLMLIQLFSLGIYGWSASCNIHRHSTRTFYILFHNHNTSDAIGVENRGHIVKFSTFL